MKQSRRQANFELLRMIAMVMVVTMHYLNYAQALPVLGENLDARRLVGALLESFCIVAVNVYVMISGYFLVTAGFRIRRLLRLLCQILFYTIGIPLVFAGAGGFKALAEGGIYRLLGYIFPIQTEHYWFVTSYVLMYLFSPILNAAVRSMSKKKLQLVLWGLFLLFCAGKSMIPFRLAFDRFGYDFGWFLFVYLLAAYIRLHGAAFLNSARRAWLLYVGCGLLGFIVVIGSYLVYSETLALEYYFTVPYHYNYILCLLGAAALFCGFGFLKIPQGRIQRAICAVSPLTFGVYLFHEHQDIRLLWTDWLRGGLDWEGSLGVAGFILELVVCVAAVFAAGLLVDAIRSALFSLVGSCLKGSRISLFVDRLDARFSSAEYKDAEK